MRIEVLMSSGETDGWNGVTDAIIENGALHVLEEVKEHVGEILVKTVKITESIDQGPDLPTGELTRVHLLRGTYAPGMWMKVVYLP